MNGGKVTSASNDKKNITSKIDSCDWTDQENDVKKRKKITESEWGEKVGISIKTKATKNYKAKVNIEIYRIIAKDKCELYDDYTEEIIDEKAFIKVKFGEGWLCWKQTKAKKFTIKITLIVNGESAVIKDYRNSKDYTKSSNIILIKLPYIPQPRRQVALDDYLSAKPERKGKDKIKSSCRVASFMAIIRYKLQSEGLDVGNKSDIEIYEEAKKKGDKIIEGYTNMKDPAALAKIFNANAKFSNSTTENATFSNIIKQLSNGNPVMVILDDGHGEVIYKYETDKYRFLLDDVGYQRDSYLPVDTMRSRNSIRESTFKGVIGGASRKAEYIQYLIEVKK